MEVTRNNTTVERKSELEVVVTRILTDPVQSTC